MVKAQEYLDTNYPKETRWKITKLKIDGENLEGSLDLSDFENLKDLNFSFNQITNLNISKSVLLESVRGYGNPRIEENISIFSHLTELKELVLGVSARGKASESSYSGSLESLKDCKKLSFLALGYCDDVVGGLEYLDPSVEFNYVDSNYETELNDFAGDIYAWRLVNHPELITDDLEVLMEKIKEIADKDHRKNADSWHVSVNNKHDYKKVVSLKDKIIKLQEALLNNANEGIKQLKEQIIEEREIHEQAMKVQEERWHEGQRKELLEKVTKLELENIKLKTQLLQLETQKESCENQIEIPPK